MANKSKEDKNQAKSEQDKNQTKTQDKVDVKKADTKATGKEMPKLKDKLETLYKRQNLDELLNTKEDIEKLVDRIETHHDKKWEKLFIPALMFFTLIAILGYYVIYSITVDMRTLAKSMDPKMEYHMATMSKGVVEISSYMKDMKQSVYKMNQSISKMNTHLGTIKNDFSVVSGQVKLMASSMHSMNKEIRTLTPMVKNIHNMNNILSHIERSLKHITQDVRRLSINIDKPMNIMNSVPFW